ncbi:urea ABC transporter substrate-binding protein [Mariprofundus sp. EBB-1]|uniref:urea ABC transporter substrate-binding protein n=1 Tax=Mariprofundus sp. EBB-1 TaxID=2650971 RepID=UPI0013799CB0|nr:urea ABC transporter substrate-binding protein [Mariprofundus sp. EBB-1]
MLPAASFSQPASGPIRVGILHSQTGTMARSEKPVINATLLAIEQINANGGLLGRRVEAVIADGKSDENVFAAEAERLITEEHVDVLFGCWTSASRKAVKLVVEKLDHLLFYPVQYEGLESSDHIIYTGAAPNQQIVPAVSWAVKKFGPRVYLIGSNYIFPRVANWLINRQLPLINAEVVGEQYILLGSNDVSDIINDIQDKQPDVIFNSINGDSNVAFFHALREAGISAKEMPVVSFSLAESGIRLMPIDEIAGHYAVWNYFQSLPSAQNKAFISALYQHFGEQPVSDPMEAAWVGVQMWANAVRGARTSDPKAIHNNILQQSLAAPEGIVSVDQGSNHLWKTAYIGQVNRQHQFDVIWSSEHALKPFPYPLFVSKHEAEWMLNRLYSDWNRQWSAPVPAASTAPANNAATSRPE